ncbi:MAG TPA: PAS domain-containing protein [Pyrinomonadaceae bacterium]|nr:PAS domain-containing protein [Pyrinomonadaceae bacterium]
MTPLHSLPVTATKISRLLIFLLALVSSSVAQTALEPPRTIRVVVDNAYAPYSFQSDDGKLQGILIDQWQAWEKKTGIKAEIHAMDWGEALRRMRAGDFDVIDSIVETAERRDYFDFTPAYTTIEASIYFRKDISGISDLASLKGFPVGVKTGDQHIDQLKANGVTAVIPFQNNDAIIEAAKQHRVNVFVVDDPSALYLLNKLGVEEEFRHSAPVFQDELRRAVRKGDAAMLRRVSEGFAAIDAGELKQIDEKWFGRTLNRYGRYLTYAGYAAAVALLLIAGLVGWNRTLRKRIAQRTAELGESEQRFRQIAENIREVFWMSTGDFGAPLFTMLYISPAYESVWGRTCESLYRDPHSFIDAIHPDDRARVADVNERDQEQGFEIEYRVVRPDGSMRWIRDRGFPIRDEAGRFYRLTGIAEDITERKQAEEALDERLRFETLVSELSAAFANLSPNEVDREIDKWLQTLVEFLGVDRATFFQFGEDWTTLYRSHSYTVPGIEPLPPPPIGLKDQFPWIMDQLRRGVTVKWSRIPDDMPEEAAKEKEYAAKVGVKSGLNIPVLVGGSVICAISFTSIKTYHDWPDAMAARLRLVGEIFAAAVERKRAEAALRKSEEQFRQMAENIREVFWLTTADLSKMLYISPAYEAVWGQSSESLYREPRAFFAAIHAEDRSRVVDIIERDREQGFEVEYRVVRPDGSIRWIRDRGFPIKDELGRFYRVAGIAEDITERKEAEDALRRSEDRLRLVIDTIPTMAWSLQPDGVIDFVNQRWMDYTGLSLEEAIAEPTGTMHPEDLSAASAEWGANMAAEEPFEGELRLRRADGEYRWFLVRTDPLRDEQGKVVKWYGASIDIEDRKRAEETLQYSQTQLAEAQRLAHVGSWEWNLLTNAVTWSDELYRIFGLQPGKMNLPGDAIPFIHPEDRDLVFSTVESAVKNKEPFSFYYRVLRPDGDERIAHSRGHIVCAENGQPIRVFGATQDVTELKQAEEKLKATSEQLRALSARLQSAREEEGTRIAREIHDELGSALTSLKWDLEGMEKMPSDPKSGPELASMREKAKTMTRLVDGTIDVLRRISAELRPGVLDDLGLVSAIEWQARQFHDRTGIAVHCDCSLDDVNLNQEQSTAAFRILQEALTNVLRHAQATRIDIRAAEAAGEFMLTISDNGRGISEDETSGLKSLGLLGMRERAILIGGKIDIAGVAGKGTVITLTVPIGRAGGPSDPAND